MNDVTIILLLVAITTGLSLAAVSIRVPYPTAMVIAGLIIGAAVFKFPRLDSLSIQLDPRVLFTAILPPLLYAAAWNTSWNSFRANLRPIVMLATGAVVFTTVGIAGTAMLLIPGFTWPMAFTLGAVVSPPDAVAVGAVTERLRIPKRITTILEGESLVNDASALVIYRFALAAAMGATFSLSTALWQFPLVVIGGVGVGLGMAFLLHQVHQRIEQPLIETALTLLTPYAAYLLAESIETSGVLAVVTCGIVLSRHSPHLFSSQTRLIAVGFWTFLTFMLNGLVCILIGLQLPAILRQLHVSLPSAIGYAAVVCAVLLALRILWMFPAAYLPRVFPSVRKKEPRPSWQQVLLVGWVGMRGVVSLAAALSIPAANDKGTPLPARDLVLFLTFAVILVTLVGQSLTLPAVIRLLRIESPKDEQCEETEARRRALTSALELLSTQAESHESSTLRTLYAHRLEHLANCDDAPEGVPDREEVLLLQTIRVQRTTLVGLRDKGQISDELLRKLERELDLEESRIPR